MNRELAKINVFVLPSLFGEGLPMVVLEAMAAGLPVVASRVEGVPEAVAHRETGLLVEPGSVSQLAAAIEEIVSGDVDYAALSRGARRRHAAQFSDTTMAAGVAAVYRDVLAARLARPNRGTNSDYRDSDYACSSRLSTCYFTARLAPASPLAAPAAARRRASNPTASAALEERFEACPTGCSPCAFATSNM